MTTDRAPIGEPREDVALAEVFVMRGLGVAPIDRVPAATRCQYRLIDAATSYPEEKFLW